MNYYGKTGLLFMSIGVSKMLVQYRDVPFSYNEILSVIGIILWIFILIKFVLLTVLPHKKRYKYYLVFYDSGKLKKMFLNVDVQIKSIDDILKVEEYLKTQSELKSVLLVAWYRVGARLKLKH
jgi:hypothetical protein